VEHFDWRWKEAYQRLVALFEDLCIKRRYRGRVPYIQVKVDRF